MLRTRSYSILPLQELQASVLNALRGVWVARTSGQLGLAHLKDG